MVIEGLPTGHPRVVARKEGNGNGNANVNRHTSFPFGKHQEFTEKNDEAKKINSRELRDSNGNNNQNQKFQPTKKKRPVGNFGRNGKPLIQEFLEKTLIPII